MPVTKWLLKPVQASAQAASKPVAAPNADVSAEKRALLDKYCVGCHNARVQNGKMRLDTADVTKVGENISVRRFEVIESSGNVGTYVHGARIGVLVELEGGTPDLARDLAMQVASLAPRYTSNDEVPKDVLDKEREIILAQTAEEKKPPEILANLRARYHLDDPLWQQYLTYLWNLLHWDFGPSFKYKDFTVTELIAQGFPVSFQNGLAAILLVLQFAPVAAHGAP